MKKILVLVVLFIFGMNVNAQGPSLNDEASADVNDDTYLFIEEETKPVITKSIATINKRSKEYLLDRAKGWLKKEGDSDYKLINFYHVDKKTKPVFHNDGSISSFYVYLERGGSTIVCMYSRTKTGAHSVRFTSQYKGSVKKQLDF